jgi:hypothetical protein
MVTCSLSLILGVNEQLKISVGGYHRARAALTQLASPLSETTWEETLHPLLEDDVHIMTAAQAEGVSEGRWTMSWIWRTAGVGDSSVGMQEGMYGRSCVFDMLILIEMFSTSVGVMQNSRKGPSLAGGISVIGGRDATGCRSLSCGRSTCGREGLVTRGAMQMVTRMGKLHMLFARQMSAS